MSPEKAFAILAPPIIFNKSTWQELIRSSAAKLYYVLTHARRVLETRIASESSEEKWYLKIKEFEHLLLSAGVDWIERATVPLIHRNLDLNKSGFLHISELCAVFQSAEEICRDILNGQIDLRELKKDIAEISVDYPSLTSQLSSGKHL